MTPSVTFSLRSLAAAAIFCSTTSAHMFMRDPLPIGLSMDGLNPSDGTYVAPLSRLEAPGTICGGHHASGPPSDLSGLPKWTAGGKESFTIAGQEITVASPDIKAAHGGGSCQASISYDQGKTFYVLKSYLGACPRNTNGGNNAPNDQVFDFDIPANAPSGTALFSWTWFSKANVESYMNCAWVTVSSSTPASDSSISTFASSYPKMFDGWTKPETSGGCYLNHLFGETMLFPEPGENVKCSSDATELFALPMLGTGCLAESVLSSEKLPCGLKSAVGGGNKLVFTGSDGSKSAGVSGGGEQPVYASVSTSATFAVSTSSAAPATTDAEKITDSSAIDLPAYTSSIPSSSVELQAQPAPIPATTVESNNTEEPTSIPTTDVSSAEDVDVVIVTVTVTTTFTNTAIYTFTATEVETETPLPKKRRNAHALRRRHVKGW